MEIVIPTCGREVRLTATVASIAAQVAEFKGRITILCNNGFCISPTSAVAKILHAIERHDWAVRVLSTPARTISTIKREALTLCEEEPLMMLDEDVLFTTPGTISALVRGLQLLVADAISPIGFEVDDERPILNEFQSEYRDREITEGAYSQGTIALGMCVMLTAKGRDIALRHWCADLPYLEDQVMLHFVKKFSNYLWCHSHPVIHLSAGEDRAYKIDDSEVIRYLETLSKNRPEYLHLLALRRVPCDGVAFDKMVERREVSA